MRIQITIIIIVIIVSILMGVAYIWSTNKFEIVSDAENSAEPTSAAFSAEEDNNQQESVRPQPENQLLLRTIKSERQDAFSLANEMNEAGKAGMTEEKTMLIKQRPSSLRINYREQEGSIFELPIKGATGWAAHALTIRSEPQQNSEPVIPLEPGQAFTILGEDGNWWRVRLEDGTEGWAVHGGCFINLPDVLPSIVYDATNAYSSMKRSSGYEIPNITGQAHYEAIAYNERFDRVEFFVPALYATSKKIAAVQAAALAGGNTLIVHEVFRPWETQQAVVRNLTDLVNSNAEVRRAITTPPWSMGAFIATSMSNHQRGAAIDVSLASIATQENMESGDYIYPYITGFREYEMPSLMHELSPLAAPGGRATEGSMLLRSYFTSEGFGTVGSEWWHFDDRAGIGLAANHGVTGGFYAASILSEPPVFDGLPNLSMDAGHQGAAA